mgnify:CR=1 FL=1
MKYGFHVLEASVAEERDLFLSEKQISIIRFLKQVESESLEKYEDYVILGLEDLLSGIEDHQAVASYINHLLKEKGNYFFNKQNIFFFLIERGEIEIWDDRPMLKLRGDRDINLQEIFGAIENYEDDPNWFWQQLNISS